MDEVYSASVQRIEELLANPGPSGFTLTSPEDLEAFRDEIRELQRMMLRSNAFDLYAGRIVPT